MLDAIVASVENQSFIVFYLECCNSEVVLVLQYICLGIGCVKLGPWGSHGYGLVCGNGSKVPVPDAPTLEEEGAIDALG